MPGPLGPAAVFAGPGAVAAAKHLAHRAAAATSPAVTSSTLTAVLFYWSFQKLPDWVKEDISFKNLLQNREDLSREEFVGLISVVEKLQKIGSNIKDLDIDIPQLHAALLAFIQLCGQHKLQQINSHRCIGSPRAGTAVNNKVGDLSLCSSSMTSTTAESCSSLISTTVTRDSLYESAGKTLDIPSVRSSEIQDALKMATLAYYEDAKVCLFCCESNLCCPSFSFGRSHRTI